jgi:oryzin
MNDAQLQQHLNDDRVWYLFIFLIKKLYKNYLQVAYVEQDSVVKVASGEEVYNCPTTQSNDEYFLPRISYNLTRTSVPASFKYVTSAATGVYAYVLDTGIYQGHTEYAGRVILGPSFISGETINDLNGHGTCCAGILGGTLYGAAKKVTIIPVKVLGNSGTGTWAAVISGIQWAVADARVNKVIFSLGYKYIF